MRLLFITQKIHANDDDLAFIILWIKEFIKQGLEVEVICLEKGDFDNSFSVHSLGKEAGRGKITRLLRFLKLITTLQYDAVFVHMNPEYFTYGGWWWFVRGTPAYLWYTHYTMTLHMFLAGIFGKKLFAATAQSLPQYEGNPKKIILGHGIDTEFWGVLSNDGRNPHQLLSVHRLSRSKRLEIVIETLSLLPEEYTLTVYGRPIDSVYFRELADLVRAKNLEKRVFFKGPVPMHVLPNIYSQYRLMVNMASETIDKTMLEALFLGVYPVTTPRNARAIGLTTYPADETPDTLARFIQSREWDTISPIEGRALVEKRHSLTSLVRQLIQHMTL